MKTLQDIYQERINELLKPEVILFELIKKRLSDLGIKLSKKQLTQLKTQLADFKDGGFSLKFDDKQISKAGFSDIEQFKSIINNLPNDLIVDLKFFEDSLQQELPSFIMELIKEATDIKLSNLKSDLRMILKYHRKEIERFKKNLLTPWGQALDLLEFLIQIAVESGEAFNSEFRQLASEKNDLVFDVLTRLHARACQIASEILTLLKNGYADGAHARWRALYEVVVVAIFVREKGNEIAERYLCHNVIQSYNSADDYQKHCLKLGYEKFTDEELQKMENAKNELVEKYGKGYKNLYGWAAKALGREKPRFKDIEESVGLEYMRPYYNMACHNVHADSKGILFKLGLHPESSDILLAGPSNVGLADPGFLTAIALTQITKILLTHDPNLDRLVVCNILDELTKITNESFLEAHEALEEKIRNST